MPVFDETGTLAQLLRAIESYLDDVVLIGGWVHALYMQELEPEPSSIRTTDVDLAVPRELPSGNRRPLLALVE